MQRSAVRCNSNRWLHRFSDSGLLLRIQLHLQLVSHFAFLSLSFLVQIILRLMEEVKLILIMSWKHSSFRFVAVVWERGLSADYLIDACTLNEMIHMFACCHHLCQYIFIVHPKKGCNRTKWEI